MGPKLNSLFCWGMYSKTHWVDIWAPRNHVPLHVVTPQAVRIQVERASVKSPSSNRFWGTPRIRRWSQSGNTLTPKACLVLLVQRPSKAAKTTLCRPSSIFQFQCCWCPHTSWKKHPLEFNRVYSLDTPLPQYLAIFRVVWRPKKRPPQVYLICRKT